MIVTRISVYIYIYLFKCIHRSNNIGIYGTKQRSTRKIRDGVQEITYIEDHETYCFEIPLGISSIKSHKLSPGKLCILGPNFF